MKLFDQLKRLWTMPSATEIAARELSDAERQKLAAENAVEYAQSMLLYHDNRIVRLRNYLKEAR